MKEQRMKSIERPRMVAHVVVQDDPEFLAMSDEVTRREIAERFGRMLMEQGLLTVDEASDDEAMIYAERTGASYATGQKLRLFYVSAEVLKETSDE